MVRQFVTFMLGEFGNKVLQFYIDHSPAINGAVVAYGVLILISYVNLRRIEKAAVETMRRRMGNPAGPDEVPSSVWEIQSAFPWQETIKQASFFPLVARGNSLLPCRTNASNLRKLISVSQLMEQISAESPGPAQSD